MNMEFARTNQNTDAVSEEFFYVNNCGYYTDIDTDIKVHRLHGRKDWQIICVTSGKLTVKLQNRKYYLTEGECVLFRPREEQIYGCDVKSKTSYCWMHFSGKECENILKNCNLTETLFKTENLSDFISGCSAIINESRIRQNETYITGRALCMLSRLREKREGRFAETVKKMAEDAEKGVTSDYAHIAGMSKYSFIRAFKSEMHVTPLRYITRLKTEKAKLLLTETDIKICDIAKRLGYDDPLYFSAVFKKYEGVSPKNYREKVRK